MKKMFATCLLATALLACGGKNKAAPSSTTPKPEAKDGSATGGATYGAKTPATPATAPADPCAAQ